MYAITGRVFSMSTRKRMILKIFDICTVFKVRIFFIRTNIRLCLNVTLYLFGNFLGRLMPIFLQHRFSFHFSHLYQSIINYFIEIYKEKISQKNIYERYFQLEYDQRLSINLICNNLYHQHITIGKEFIMSKQFQIDRLLNIQNLLNEYERENKSLNQQILDLLAQNKALKIHKINNQSFKQSEKYSKKQNSSLEKSNRRDENLIEKMWKLKKEQKSIQKSQKKEKKDQGVQVNTFNQENKQKQTHFKVTTGHKLLGSDTFSFGQNTVRQNNKPKHVQQRYDKACSPVKFTETVQQQFLSNIIQKVIQSNLSSKTPIQACEITEKRTKQESVYIKKQDSYLSPTKRIKKRIQDGDQGGMRKRRQSSHAILPSPQVMIASNSQSRLSIADQNSKEKTFISRIKKQSSVERITASNQQKKKTFIQVITDSQTGKPTRVNNMIDC